MVILQMISFPAVLVTLCLTGQCSTQTNDNEPLLRRRVTEGTLLQSHVTTSITTKSSNVEKSGNVTSSDALDTTRPMSSIISPTEATSVSNGDCNNTNGNSQVGNEVSKRPAIPLECLRLTYNDTTQVYSFPDYSYYIIWFKPLMTKGDVKLRFDYSLYQSSKEPSFMDFTKYIYEVTPWQWHQISLEMKDNSLLLNIPEIELQERVPHITISHMQVSSGNGLILWSICNPEGDWWNENMDRGEFHSLSTQYNTIVSLIVCLIFSLMTLVILGLYVSHQQRLLRKAKKEREDDESVYAEWKPVAQNDGSALTPPTSTSYDTCDGNKTFNTILTTSSYTCEANDKDKVGI